MARIGRAEKWGMAIAHSSGQPRLPGGHIDRARKRGERFDRTWERETENGTHGPGGDKRIYGGGTALVILLVPPVPPRCRRFLAAFYQYFLCYADKLQLKSSKGLS